MRIVIHEAHGGIGQTGKGHVKLTGGCEYDMSMFLGLARAGRCLADDATAVRRLEEKVAKRRNTY
ncbi:unnamed protein product [Ectocarpus sp. CCAP 1310/34]|nr:unnamed protein product [Ectocarpus sp. CCAP 1310/34]